MYFIVPVNNGLLDIEYADLIQGIQISATECYVKLREQSVPRATWTKITEQDFEAVQAMLEPSE